MSYWSHIVLCDVTIYLDDSMDCQLVYRTCMCGAYWGKKGPLKVENRGFIRGIKVTETQIAFYEVEGVRVRLFPGIMIL